MSAFRLAFGAMATMLLAACASGGGYTAADPQPRHGFSELGSRPAAAPPAPRMRQAPALPAPPADEAAPASLLQARRNIDAFLRAQGFEAEDEANGSPDRITATRMSTDILPPEEADCALHALARPRMYATTLHVQLSPGTVGVDARFTVMDVGVVSGALTKHVCRTRGALEAEVRQAAMTGRYGG